jgi:hypothetical protein
MTKTLLAVAAMATFAVCVVPAAHAEDTAKRGGWTLGADLDFGGDDVATVDFTDGSSQDIAAGQGVNVSVGGYFRPAESSQFTLRGSLGYKFVTTAATNADINMSRVALQLMGDYHFNSDWWGGIGVVQHSGIELDGDGFFQDISFDDATGFAAELGWRWIGLHYTNIEYDSEFGGTIDASNVGMRFLVRF